jgi:hypothetical protein
MLYVLDHTHADFKPTAVVPDFKPTAGVGFNHLAASPNQTTQPTKNGHRTMHNIMKVTQFVNKQAIKVTVSKRICLDIFDLVVVHMLFNRPNVEHQLLFDESGKGSRLVEQSDVLLIIVKHCRPARSEMVRGNVGKKVTTREA